MSAVPGNGSSPGVAAGQEPAGGGPGQGPPSAVVLEVRDLRRSYPGVLAVQDFGMQLNRGEILGLVGPNGAGKSTVIKMLAGAVKPERGEIVVAGETVDIAGPLHATQLGLTFVHQELTDVPNLTVSENVLLGLKYPRWAGTLVNKRAMNDKARGILRDSLQVEIDPNALVASLSVAQRRLIMVARGLATEAKVLVLDEPTASLTDQEIVHLHGVIRRVAAAGTAVIYVSHRLDEIFTLTGRVVVMRGGRKVADLATNSLDHAQLVDHITGVAAKTRQAVTEEAGAGIAKHHAEAGDELLRVEGLTRAGVVDDVSFTLHQGEVLGIAGLVGAGRTELARIIYGADPRTSGEVFVRGKSTRLRGPRDGLAAGIVLLPEERRTQGMVVDFTIRENVTLPVLGRFRIFRGVPIPQVRKERERARALIDQLGIKTPGEEWPVRLLSGGNQQKVVLAKWIEHGADVFIFDEPTHGVDVAGKLEVYALMSRLAHEGYGVIFISSEFEELEEVCRRVLVMREGRIVGELHDAEVTVTNLISACYAEAPAAAPIATGAPGVSGAAG
jgi:ABC-type sugar transport system ATPase subunit